MAIAAVVVALGLLYALAVEPAWRERARLLRELPRLQEQAVEVEALAARARGLRNQGIGAEPAQALPRVAEASLARAGLAARIEAAGTGTLVVRADKAPALAWFKWMEGFARDSRLRIASTKVSRTDAPGWVAAEVAFEVPPR